MSKKPAIKPIHLVLIGTAIIILGILIPSLLINAFSTIGFSIIIGLLIIVSAYVFFSINTVKAKGARTIKWLLIPVVIALVGGGVFYAYHNYQQSMKDKVYSAGDVIKLPEFDFTVSKVDFSKIPLNTKDVNLDDRKDCSNDQSHECTWYNWPRSNAQNYLNEYYRANIEYSVDAKEPVQGKDLKVSVVPDSGREIIFNTGSESNDDLYSFLWVLKLDYTANPKSDFGGMVNRGIVRKGSLGVDLKNSEKVFDIVVSYHGETRIIRISR